MNSLKSISKLHEERPIMHSCQASQVNLKKKKLINFYLLCFSVTDGDYNNEDLIIFLFLSGFTQTMSKLK